MLGLVKLPIFLLLIRKRNVILSGLLFLTDFLCAAYFEQWLVYGLAAYFFVILSIQEPSLRDFLIKISTPLTLLLIQGFFLHDRFGLMLSFIIPLILLALIINRVVIHPAFLLPLFSSYFFICQDFIIKKCFFSQNFLIDVTIKKIFINLAIGYLVLWGTRGNRSFQRK